MGEDNSLHFLPRGSVLGIANTVFDALHQFGAALATGNRFVLAGGEGTAQLLKLLPKPLLPHIELADEWRGANFDAVLLSDEARLGEILRALAERRGAIVQVTCGAPEFRLSGLVKEKTVSVNTAAAGGNASLMTIGR